ncbi:MAG: Deoxyribose-phosphate aldolase, partial [uncultured Friedmanniella sp.]
DDRQPHPRAQPRRRRPADRPHPAAARSHPGRRAGAGGRGRRAGHLRGLRLAVDAAAGGAAGQRTEGRGGGRLPQRQAHLGDQGGRGVLRRGPGGRRDRHGDRRGRRQGARLRRRPGRHRGGPARGARPDGAEGDPGVGRAGRRRDRWRLPGRGRGRCGLRQDLHRLPSRGRGHRARGAADGRDRGRPARYQGLRWDPHPRRRRQDGGRRCHPARGLGQPCAARGRGGQRRRQPL